MNKRYRNALMVMGLIGSVLVPASLSWAKTYLIAEDMSSSLRVGVQYRITAPAGISKLSVKNVWLPNKGNPASQQKITDFKLIPSVPATSKEESTDQWGNRIIVQTWARPPSYLSGVVEYRAILHRNLERFRGTFPYPIPSLPDETKVYLQPTDLIQSNNHGISLLAKKLLGPVQDQIYGVAQVLNFVIDHIRYLVDPSRFDAVYTLQNGLGNCQNYAHLAAALLRNGGIPTRVVTGITSKKGWQAKTGTASWNLTLGQGRHAWLEVFYPDFGWVGYDPQQTLNFVSTRHIAIEVGSDAGSASSDGAVVWTSSGTVKPVVEEKISIVFEKDKDSFTTSGEQLAPRNNLFSSTVVMPSPEPKPAIKKPVKPAIPRFTLDEVKRFRVAGQRTFGVQKPYEGVLYRKLPNT